MGYSLPVEDGSEWLLALKDKSLRFGREKVEVYLDRRENNRLARTVDLQDDLSGKHIVIQDPPQDAKSHFSLVGL